MSYDEPKASIFTNHPPRGQWRATVTAPRDGTRFLVWRNFDQRVHVASISEIGTWSLKGVTYYPEIPPDYWQPCPQPPLEQ